MRENIPRISVLTIPCPRTIGRRTATVAMMELENFILMFVENIAEDASSKIQ